MEIYREVQVFDKKTGKPTTEKEWCETRSDWSGDVLYSKDEKNYPFYYAQYQLDYGDQDACCGSDGDEYEFGKEYGVSMHEFLHQPYVFNDGAIEGENETPAWAADFLKEVKTSVKKFENVLSLEGYLRGLRVRTATKLIKSGVIKPEQLSSPNHW